MFWNLCECFWNRAALKKFQEIQPANQSPTFSASLLECTQSCYEFDVSSQPVSVHLPLSRMISGLLLALPKHGLLWDCSELDLETKPSLLQLMETPLRLQVLIAQVCIDAILVWSRLMDSTLNRFKPECGAATVIH